MRRAFGAALALLAGACRHLPAVPPAVLDSLRSQPGAYLSGPVVDLFEPVVLDDRDFVYDIRTDRRGREVAFSHLGAHTFRLGLWALEPAPSRVADVEVNPNEFDVEALDFSPDGNAVVTASRDGSLRFYSAHTGQLVASCALDEPLVSVAFHPGGDYVLAGGAQGQLSMVALASLQPVFETRAHQGEVRAIAVGPDGAVYSGGWDRSVAVFEAVPAELPSGEARVWFEREAGETLVRGRVDGAPVRFAVDERLPLVVVTAQVAERAGLTAANLPDSVEVPTALGTTRVRVAKGRTLTFKALTLTGAEVGICDACVPAGAQGVLGAAFARRVEVVVDEQAHELLFTARDRAASPGLRALALRPKTRMRFDGYVNDLSLDHAGKRLGLALSEEKAQRSLEVYQREQRGETPPRRAGDRAAIVDAATGAVVQAWNAHQGVVATAGISPDGQALASGGWDRRLLVQNAGTAAPVAERELGWSVRRVRFSPDGRRLLVAAWTPQNAVGNQRSRPSAVVYEVSYAEPRVNR